MKEKRETPEEVAERVRAALPPYLRQPRDLISEEKRAQALQAASFTRARLTDEERLVARGKQLEEIARANLATKETPEGRIRLSRGLELQGRYAEAAECHPHKRERKRLLAIEGACDREDSEVCNCPPKKLRAGGEAVEVPRHYEVKKVYSRRHGRVVSLVGCGNPKCSFLNATPTPPEQLAKVLAAQAGADAEAVAMRRGAQPQRGRRVVADLQILK